MNTILMEVILVNISARTSPPTKFCHVPPSLYVTSQKPTKEVNDVKIYIYIYIYICVCVCVCVCVCEQVINGTALQIKINIVKQMQC